MTTKNKYIGTTRVVRMVTKVKGRPYFFKIIIYKATKNNYKFLLIKQPKTEDKSIATIFKI